MTRPDVQTVTSGALRRGVESWNHLLVGYDQISQAETRAKSGVWQGAISVQVGLAMAKAQVDEVIRAHAR